MLCLHYNTTFHHGMWFYDMITIYIHYTLFNSIPMHKCISHPLAPNTSNYFILELYQSPSDSWYTVGIPVGPLHSYPHDYPSRSTLLSPKLLPDVDWKLSTWGSAEKALPSHIHITVPLGLPPYHLSALSMPFIWKRVSNIHTSIWMDVSHSVLYHVNKLDFSKTEQIFC